MCDVRALARIFNVTGLVKDLPLLLSSSCQLLEHIKHTRSTSWPILIKAKVAKPLSAPTQLAVVVDTSCASYPKKAALFSGAFMPLKLPLSEIYYTVQ
jgi:hypothetical protein